MAFELDQRPPVTFAQKLREMDWVLVVLIFLVGCLGTALLYSAGDGWDRYAAAHFQRFAVCMLAMLVLAVVDIRYWIMLAYPAYIGSLVLLVGVEFIGEMGKNSQRWLDIGPIRVQPSEFMKVAIVMALARYYHDLKFERVSHPFALIIPILLIVLPAALIFRQPDLGTAILVAASGLVVVFLAGLGWRWIVSAFVAAIVALPLVYSVALKPYQKARVNTYVVQLFGGESDPLGKDYQIEQSKIALGSGGLNGKGFMNGTQSRLNFLPEKQTDFILGVLGEEFGFVGSLVLLALYSAILVCGFAAGWRARSRFSRLLTGGITATFGLYVFINVAMVAGLLPVVGVPLPLVSYGGNVMLTVMGGFGLILSARVHRHAELPRSGFDF